MKLIKKEQTRILLACILLTLIPNSYCLSEEIQWHVLHTLTPSLPENPSDAFLAAFETSPHLSASWGERESLYIYIEAMEKNLQGVTLIAESFTGEFGEVLDASSLSLHWCDTNAQNWADAQWPVEVVSGTGRWLRLDWTSPVDAEAGNYSGLLRLKTSSVEESLSLELQLWPFDPVADLPLKRLKSESGPTLEDLAFGAATQGRARVTAQSRGDLPGPGAGPLAARILPLAAWRMGLSGLSVDESNPAFDFHFEDGMEDLSYYLLLCEDTSLLAERIAAQVPVRDLLRWNSDPAKLLHWRLAAGSYLSGEEGIALHLVREMEVLSEGAHGEERSLLDPEGAAWGWKGASVIDVLENGCLSLGFDENHSTVRFKPRLRDWRRDGFLEIEIRLAEGEDARLDLVLAQSGFRKTSWSYRLHLRPGEWRTLSIPLPRTQIDLGKIHQVAFRLADTTKPCRLEIRNLRLR